MSAIWQDDLGEVLLGAGFKGATMRDFSAALKKRLGVDEPEVDEPEVDVNENDPLGGIRSMIQNNPAIQNVIAKRAAMLRPVGPQTVTKARPAIIGGFKLDGKAGQVLTVPVSMQQLFRADSIHATDWVPDMALVDPQYCQAYITGLAVGQVPPQPGEFVVVDANGVQYKAKFYPPPGSSTRIVYLFVGSINTTINGPTSAFAPGFVAFKTPLVTANIGLTIAMQVEFLRDAHFEAALSGIAI